MSGKYRQFKEFFIDYMLARKAWPEAKHFQFELEARGHPKESNWLSSLRNKRAAPTSYCREMVQIILACPTADFARSRAILLEFLAECGFRKDSPDIEGALSHVCWPPTDESPKEGERDWIQEDVRGVMHAPIQALLNYCLLSRATQADAHEVTRWLYIRVAQSLHPRGNAMSDNECVVAAEDILMRPFSEYAALVHGWSNSDAWTVLRASRGGFSYGMSILLPTSKKIYDEMSSGKRALDDVNPSDIRVPSDRIIFLALAENPEALRRRKNPTRTMLNALIVQHAALMRYGCSDTGPEYRFLAAEATKENRERMVRAGFKALTTRDPRTKKDNWERVINFDTGEGVAVGMDTVMRSLSRYAQAVPRVF